ncbi:hypothetical protein [Peribacillus sp. NPDC058076]|uniref:hypothetical protein n=1 Tax=Peribacillus sp. NPDC058076 TaxID=3346329 RepID=UPI0036D91B6E
MYKVAAPISDKKSILRSIHTTMANGVSVKVVFVQNRNNMSEWLAILSTDCTLSEQELVRIYGCAGTLRSSLRKRSGKSKKKRLLCSTFLKVNKEATLFFLILLSKPPPGYWEAFFTLTVNAVRQVSIRMPNKPRYG